MPVRPEEKIRCSFCGKTQDQVRKMIAGTGNVFICDECIELCGEILEEELRFTYTEEGCTVTARCRCWEEIGQIQEILVE